MKFYTALVVWYMHGLHTWINTCMGYIHMRGLHIHAWTTYTRMDYIHVHVLHIHAWTTYTHGLHTHAWTIYICMDYIHTHGLHTYAWTTYTYMDYVYTWTTYTCMDYIHTHGLCTPMWPLMTSRSIVVFGGRLIWKVIHSLSQSDPYHCAEPEWSSSQAACLRAESVQLQAAAYLPAGPTGQWQHVALKTLVSAIAFASSVLPLHSAYTALLFYLSHISNTYLFIVVMPTACAMRYGILAGFYCSPLSVNFFISLFFSWSGTRTQGLLDAVKIPYHWSLTFSSMLNGRLLEKVTHN